MRILDGSHTRWEPGPEAAVTVGVMDGVHRGHRKLLARLVEQGPTPTVATFEPHPVEVLARGVDPRLITSLSERISLLESCGIEQVAVLDLNEIREFSPERFVVEILVERLRLRRIVVGVDFQFGKNRTGTVAHLNRLGSEHGFAVEVVNLVVDEGVVSSSRIRGMIEEGDVAGAARLLESRYMLSGQVVSGDKRGRELGFPTANLALPGRKVIPGDGVYAAWAHLAESVQMAAVNVGTRPTFEGTGNRVVEAFLLDFNGDLYGRQLTVEFVARLRDEVAFDSAGELVTQMRKDVDETREILSRERRPSPRRSQPE